MKTTSFRMDAEDLQALETLARFEGRSLSDLLREAALRYLADAPRPEELLARIRGDLDVLHRRASGADAQANSNGVGADATVNGVAVGASVNGVEQRG